MSKRKPLDMWIAEALADSDKDGNCTMISLVHMVGQQEKEIHSTKFGGGKSWEPKDLAVMFEGKARSYCQDIPGVQTFQLLAFYGGRSTPQAFQPFIVNVSPENGLGGLGTEPPTEQGRLQMSMRREEMLIQQVYRRQQVMDDFTMRMLSQQGEMIRNLQIENRDAYTIVKEMLMEKALDDHNRKMQQLNFERDSAERKKWIGYIPHLANTILGREVFPQSTADTSLMESIIDSMTDDDMMKLASSVKPELWGPLASRFEAYTRKKNDEHENMKRLSANIKSPDPESDAAGDIVHVNGNGKT